MSTCSSKDVSDTASSRTKYNHVPKKKKTLPYESHIWKQKLNLLISSESVGSSVTIP